MLSAVPEKGLVVTHRLAETVNTGAGPADIHHVTVPAYNCAVTLIGFSMSPTASSPASPAAEMLPPLPINTPAIRMAAQLWAQARQQGQPTANDKTIDTDMILAAQAMTLGATEFVIATTKVGHLARFVPANLWSAITPLV